MVKVEFQQVHFRVKHKFQGETPRGVEGLVARNFKNHEFSVTLTQNFVLGGGFKKYIKIVKNSPEIMFHGFLIYEIRFSEYAFEGMYIGEAQNFSKTHNRVPRGVAVLQSSDRREGKPERKCKREAWKSLDRCRSQACIYVCRSSQNFSISSNVQEENSKFFEFPTECILTVSRSSII